MTENADILISLKPRYADQVFSGKKTIELRKRRPHIEPGTRIWIYATSPIAAIKGCASLEYIAAGSPADIWKAHERETGISKEEFDSYFRNSDVAYGLMLTDVKALQTPLALERIRELVSGFQPPQFFCRLNGTVAEMRLNARKFIALQG